MSNYWELTLWDKQTVRVKPDNVGFVKDKLAKGEGHIITSTRTIAVKDIKAFEETEVPETVAQLPTGSSILEQAAQAFKEPVITDDGAVATRAVKKLVPQKKWDTFYAYNQNYRKLSEEDGKVLVGFYLPVEQINPYTVEPCTPEEIERM